MIPKCKTALCQITSLLYNGVPLKPPAFFCRALSYSAEAGSQLRHVNCFCFPLLSIVIMMISTPFHFFGVLHFLWNFYFFGTFFLAHIIETTFFFIHLLILAQQMVLFHKLSNWVALGKYSYDISWFHGVELVLGSVKTDKVALIWIHTGGAPLHYAAIH